MVPAQVFESIIQAITSGETVRAACEDHGIKEHTYRNHIAKYPIDKNVHERARENGADAMADANPHIADNVRDPQRARNMMDARKWLASVVKPKVYGAKLDLSVVQTADPALLNSEGKARLLSMRDQVQVLVPQLIDGETVFVAEPTDKQSVSSVAPSIFD